jgi:hypothetical protein
MTETVAVQCPGCGGPAEVDLDFQLPTKPDPSTEPDEPGVAVVEVHVGEIRHECPPEPQPLQRETEMGERTPEQVEADRRLEEAVRAALVAGGTVEPDVRLATFMVIGETESEVDGEMVGRRFFRLHAHGSTEPDVTLALWLTSRASAGLTDEFLREDDDAGDDAAGGVS